LSDAFDRIRWRLAGWSLLVLSVIVLTLGTATYSSLSRSLDDQLDRALESNSQSAGTNVHEFLETGHMTPEGYRGGLFFVVANSQGAILANPQEISLADLPQDLLTSPNIQFRTLDISGDPVRAYAKRVDDLGLPNGVLIVGQSVSPERETLARVLLILLFGGVAGLLLSVVGAWFLAGRALVPIDAAVRRQQEFVADASHELRTPLTILHSATDMLDQHLDEPLRVNRTLFEQVRSEILRMERLTHDLLTLARSDRAVVRLAFGQIDLGALAAEMVHRVEVLANERGVELRLRVEGSSLTVEGDPDRLEEVGLILLDNALKHTPRGGQVEVVVGLDGKYALLEVLDTGEGIPREHLDQIFDRFYRVDRARTRTKGGVGLGLSIAQTLVSAHGGRIAVNNRPDGGVRASIWLPYLDDAAAGFDRVRGAGSADRVGLRGVSVGVEVGQPTHSDGGV
jgi:two-component system sensor histidine kinase CiaH